MARRAPMARSRAGSGGPTRCARWRRQRSEPAHRHPVPPGDRKRRPAHRLWWRAPLRSGLASSRASARSTRDRRHFCAVRSLSRPRAPGVDRRQPPHEHGLLRGGLRLRHRRVVRLGGLGDPHERRPAVTTFCLEAHVTYHREVRPGDPCASPRSSSASTPSASTISTRCTRPRRVSRRDQRAGVAPREQQRIEQRRCRPRSSTGSRASRPSTTRCRDRLRWAADGPRRETPPLTLALSLKGEGLALTLA